MNLDMRKWKSFVLQDILSIRNGKGITAEEIEENPGSFCAVQSGEENNGVLGKISLSYCKSKGYTLSEKPCLTVARTGSAGFVSFQAEGCVVGDSAKILLLDDEIASQETYIFLQAILLANQFKYSYGRKVTEEKYMQDIVDLPIKWVSENSPLIDKTHKFSSKGYVPDWEFMEQYIKSLHHKPLTTQNRHIKVTALNTSDWKGFCISSLFKVQLSKGDIKLDDMEKGDIPLVSSGESDNGIVGKITQEGDGKADIFTGNKITVDMFCNAFYQAENFYSVSHGRVNILEPKFKLTKPIGLFISTVINKEQFKFSYGRAVYSNVISDMIIKLPIKHNSDGSPVIDQTHKYSDKGYVPDWQFMENYIKSLPYGDRI